MPERISNSVAMPVEQISGFPVAAKLESRVWLVKSADATLNPSIPQLFSFSRLISSQGEGYQPFCLTSRNNRHHWSWKRLRIKVSPDQLPCRCHFARGITAQVTHLEFGAISLSVPRRSVLSGSNRCCDYCQSQYQSRVRRRRCDGSQSATIGCLMLRHNPATVVDSGRATIHELRRLVRWRWCPQWR